MKRTLLLAAMVSLVMTFAMVSHSRAAYLGNFCWNMAPFIDNIELAVSLDGGFYATHGVWRAPGFYSMAVHGTAARDPIMGGSDLALTGEDQIDSPGTLDGVHFTAKLGTGLTGTWALYLETGFINSGTLVPIACPIPDSDANVSGPTAVPVK